MYKRLHEQQYTLQELQFFPLKYLALWTKTILNYWLGIGVCPGGRGGCAGGSMCPPLRDSSVISSLSASISWACSCTNWTNRCRSRMSAFRLPVNSVPSDFCRELSICSSSFFSCSRTVNVSSLCVFSRVSCVTLPLYESILPWNKTPKITWNSNSQFF